MKHMLICLLAALAIPNIMAQNRLRPYVVTEVAAVYVNPTDSQISNSGNEIDIELEESIAPAIRLGGGVRWNSLLSTDLTYTYIGGISMDVDDYELNSSPVDVDGELEMQSHLFMVGNRFDLVQNQWESVKPYVGIGVGMAINQTDSLELNTTEVFGETTTEFAWSLKIGVDFMLAENLSLSLCYEYLDAGSAETDTKYEVSGFESEIDEPFEFDMTAHVLTVGLNWKF